MAVAQAPSLEREALCRLLDREGGCDLVGVVGAASDIGRLGGECALDVVLLDARLPGDTTWAPRPEADSAELNRAISALAGEVWVGHWTVAGLVEGLLRSGRAGGPGQRPAPLSPERAGDTRNPKSFNEFKKNPGSAGTTPRMTRATRRPAFVSSCATRRERWPRLPSRTWTGSSC